jgi:hypothetical protein
MLEYPFPSATSKGVRPLVDRLVGSAPRLSRNFTISVLPFFTAVNKGVPDSTNLHSIQDRGSSWNIPS